MEPKFLADSSDVLHEIYCAFCPPFSQTIMGYSEEENRLGICERCLQVQLGKLDILHRQLTDVILRVGDMTRKFKTAEEVFNAKNI